MHVNCFPHFFSILLLPVTVAYYYMPCHSCYHKYLVTTSYYIFTTKCHLVSTSYYKLLPQAILHKVLSRSLEMYSCYNIKILSHYNKLLSHSHGAQVKLSHSHKLVSHSQKF